jgi:hypothetical protein
LKDEGFQKDEVGRMKAERRIEEAISLSSFILHPSSFI